MASDWKETSLGAVIDVKHGFAFSGENIREEPLGDILLTPGNFAIGGGFKGDRFKYFDGKVPEDYVLTAGDLLITMTDLSKAADTLGYPAIVPHSQGPRFLHNQRLGKVLIKPEAEIDKGFLFYLLRTGEYRHEVLASATGTTVKHTSPGRILAHKAKLPPLPEQKAIARILGTLDDKIELNQRMNATLEAMAQALFKSWFMDFDPVHAKAAGRQLSVMDVDTAALFSSSCQESKIGEIPIGWRLGKIAELALFERTSINPAQFPEEVFDHFSLPAYDEGRMPIKEAGLHIKSSKLIVPSDAVLLSKLNPHIPRIWMPEIRKSHRPVCSTEFLVVRPQSPFSREYLFVLFTSDQFLNAYSTLVTGTTGSHQRIKAEAVLHLDALIPPAKLVDAFTDLVHPLFSRIHRNIAEACILAAIRDTLLPKLLSGELNVAEIAKELDCA